VRLFELGNLVARSWNVRAIAQPFMQKINAAFGETVHLATEDGGEVLYLDKLESNRLIRIVSEIGMRLPMHCTGLGKALLAHKSSSEARWILSQHGMKAMTSRTITTVPAMERELENVRRQGYAEDRGETMDSLHCVAVAIRDRDGAAKYAISVSDIDSNMKGKRWAEIIQALQEAAGEISFAIGYREENHLKK
jgi:DNA-binding IclR family transcriptional regulator